MNSDDIVGLAAILMIFGIPMVGMLLGHQRKMAELFQQNARQQSTLVSPETQMLREEIQELKALVQQQAIAIDNLSRPLPSEAPLQERVGA